MCPRCPTPVALRCRVSAVSQAVLLLAAVLLPSPPASRACIPGRHGGRRQRAGDAAAQLEPLVKDEYVPKVGEHTLVASGLPEGAVTRESPRYNDLVYHYNPDVVYKDEEGTGADFMMTKRCAEMVDSLSILVQNQWPGVRLRITEAWDEDGAHAADSLHYEGRAVDVTTSDADRTKYGMLARLAVTAGFDWVYYESWAHIHASVLSDSSEAIQWGGCFTSTSVVWVRPGGDDAAEEPRRVPMSQLRIGDRVLSVDPSTERYTYSPVLTFMDRHSNDSRLFATIATSSGQSITLTPSHLIYIASPPLSSSSSQHRGQSTSFNSVAIAKFARDVKIGDRVFVSNNSISVGRGAVVGEMVTVTEVRYHYSTGVYAPLTHTGTVVVDDIVASCYAVINSNAVAHWSFAPLRWYYRAKDVLMQPGRTSSERAETRDGLHWYARSLYGVARYTLPDSWLYGVAERKKHVLRHG